MSGPMNGTSISDLDMSGGMSGMASSMPSMQDVQDMQRMQDMQYDAMQMRQGEESHNSVNRIEQGQHYPYYDIPGLKYPQDPRVDDIEDLARDIGNNLPSQVRGGYEEFDSDVSEEEEKSSGVLSWIPPRVLESLVLIFIFFILSQPVVRDTLGKYINQINPDASGNVSTLGVVIYGTILAVLFQLAKWFLLPQCRC